MAAGEPHVPKPENPGGAEDPAAALRRLEERLDRVSAAAERLFAEAAERLATDQAPPERSHEVPPAGWQRVGSGPGRGEAREHELAELLLAITAAVRERIPDELARRLLDALRELLLALRALIDFYLERTARSWREPVQVRDIPIL
jgi:hypothetical protein